jgi:hypothetical protein
MTLGWYIHHHGRGHLHRFLSVQPQLGSVTVLSSLSRPAGLSEVTWLDLAMDAPVPASTATTVEAGGVLHWAPLGPGGYRDRMSAIAAWIAAEQPDAMVVDVSVEVALLARLAGVPVIWMAQRGHREDQPHRLAFAAASMIIAPWPAGTEDSPAEGESVARQLTHVGAVSRFDALTPVPVPEERRVLVLLGLGGHAITAADMAAAARATPDWHWDVTGVTGVAGGDEPQNMTRQPPDADVWALLGRASVVVASASGNAIAEVAAARRPLILLPQKRPFDEQRHQASVLAGAGLAEACESWPEPASWPGLLKRAVGRDPAGWSVFHDRQAASRIAARIRELTCA